MTTRSTGQRSGSGGPTRRTATARRRTSARVRRRRLGCAGLLLLTPVLLLAAWTAGSAAWSALREFGPAIESGPDQISDVTQPATIAWTGEQPSHGVDVSFPQCARTLRDMGGGFAIVGLDGGMPDRPNPCFAEQWAFALRQAGAAVYVNTADHGRGDPTKVGRRIGKADVAALGEFGVQPGTPVWLDVELTEVWSGSQARHRAVISAHLQVLADAGYPVGVYSVPALWEEITGGASLDVPTWVGIGRADPQRASATCRRTSFGGVAPSIVQRIGTGSDGRALDRNLTCPGTDLTGLVRPN